MDDDKNINGIPERPPFTRWQTVGDNVFNRIRGYGIENVDFVDPERGIRKVIVDDKGRIANFPGVVDDGWKSEYVYKNLDPVVKYITRFEPFGSDDYIMIWEIQPDGRYWEDDDGFGGDPDTEIVLYALIDKNGDFKGPFRTYSIGPRCFPIRQP